MSRRSKTEAERRFDEAVGRNIRREMMRSCLDQKTLARALRIDPSALSVRLRGGHGTNVMQFKVIIRYIGTSVDAIITPEVRALALQMSGSDDPVVLNSRAA